MAHGTIHLRRSPYSVGGEEKLATPWAFGDLHDIDAGLGNSPAGEPLRFHERFGPEGADDPRLVRYLANQVRRNVQQLIDRSRS